MTQSLSKYRELREDSLWTPQVIYEVYPPNELSRYGYDYGEGTNGFDEAATEKSLLDGALDFFGNLFGSLGKVLGGVAEAGIGLVVKVFDGVVSLATSVAGMIGNVFGSIGNFIFGRPKPPPEPLPDIFSPIAADLEGELEPFFQEIDDSLAESKAKGEEALSHAEDALDIAKAANEAVHDAAGVIRGLVDEGHTAAEAAKSKADEASAAAGTAIDKAAEAAVHADNADRINEEIKDEVVKVEQAVIDGRAAAQSAKGFAESAGVSSTAASDKAAEAAVHADNADRINEEVKVSKLAVDQAVIAGEGHVSDAKSHATAAASSASDALAYVNEASEFNDEIVANVEIAQKAVTDGKAEVTKAKAEVAKAEQASTAAGTALSAAQSVKVDVTASAEEVATALVQVVGYHGEVLEAHGESIAAATSAANSASDAANKALDASEANTSAVAAMTTANESRDAAIISASNAASKATEAGKSATKAANEALDATAALGEVAAKQIEINTSLSQGIRAAGAAAAQAGIATMMNSQAIEQVAIATQKALDATAALGEVAAKQIEINTSLSQGIRAAGAAAAQAGIATRMNSQAIKQVAIATQKALDAAAENASALVAASDAAIKAEEASLLSQQAQDARDAAQDSATQANTDALKAVQQYITRVMFLPDSSKVNSVNNPHWAVTFSGGKRKLVAKDTGWVGEWIYHSAVHRSGDFGPVIEGGTVSATSRTFTLDTATSSATLQYTIRPGVARAAVPTSLSKWAISTRNSWTRLPVSDSANGLANGVFTAVTEGAHQIMLRVGWDATTRGDKYGIRVQRQVPGYAVRDVRTIEQSGIGPLLPGQNGYRTQSISISVNMVKGEKLYLEALTSGPGSDERRIRDTKISIDWADEPSDKSDIT